VAALTLEAAAIAGGVGGFHPGTFEGGCAVTSGEGTLRGDWASVIEVAKLADEMGLDGVVLSWSGYRSGMDQFRKKVLPLLQAGRPSIAG
jgi:hypothetical protein